MTMQIKRTSTPGAAPASLLPGQLCINDADGLLFWRNSAGGISSLSLNDPKGAMTPYTPSVVPTSGAFGALGAASAAWQRINGKLIFVRFDFTITTNGTAAGAIAAGLPFAAASGFCTAAGREVATSGFIVAGQCNANSGTMAIFKDDGTYAGGNGVRFLISGLYEAA